MKVVILCYCRIQFILFVDFFKKIHLFWELEKEWWIRRSYAVFLIYLKNIYLSERQSQRARKRQRYFSFTGSLPKQLQQSVMTQAKAMYSLSVSHMEWQEPRHLSHQQLLPKHINRKLDWGHGVARTWIRHSHTRCGLLKRQPIDFKKYLLLSDGQN